MDNYFTSFRLLTHLGVNNIRATGVLNKNRLRKCTIIGDKQLQNKESSHFEQCTSSQKVELCQPKRFVRCWNKVERKYIQEQQPNQFHFYNQNMGFVNRMEQNVTKCRIGIRMKKMVMVHVCLNDGCSSSGCMGVV